MNRTDAPKKQPIAFGVNGPREDLPNTTASGDNTASYNYGFPPITMTLKSAGGLPPKGQDMNQILYELSSIGRWLSAGAINSFDDAFSTGISGYPKGAALLSDDGSKIFISTTDSNTNNPNSTITGWKDLLTYLGITVAQGSSYLTVKIGQFIIITGIISQNTTAEGNLNVTFPLAFPNSVIYLDMTQANPSYAADTDPLIFSPYPSGVGPVTTLGAAVRNTKTGASQISKFINARYIAIGY